MDIHNLEIETICAAQVAYHEGATKNERIAIIHTLRHRLNTHRWGNSLCTVAYSDGQFIGVTDETHAKIDKKTYLETQLLVLDTIVFNKYKNPVGNALYFHDDSIKGVPQWGKKKIKIGRMYFY